MAGWTCRDRETNCWNGTLFADRFKGDGSQLSGVGGENDITSSLFI